MKVFFSILKLKLAGKIPFSLKHASISFSEELEISQAKSTVVIFELFKIESGGLREGTEGEALGVLF